MTIINEEALKERARAMYTVPGTISGDEYITLIPDALRDYYTAQDGGYVLATPFYDSPADKFAILECVVRFNGLQMVLVSIDEGQALLEVHFFNRNSFGAILAAAATDASAARRLFPISGGRRVPAGDATGQVQVSAVADRGADEAVLMLTVSPIGDYSTYTLGIVSPDDTIRIDPLFSEIDFKFRPGCFSIDCAPEWEAALPPEDNPAIDYLAKDYPSFKHTLMAAMAQRVPGWQPSSEADLDQVLLEVFCAAADELSDFQDRVMNEAYLGSARKRVSLARHARLMDYHIHQGNQASTWLAMTLDEGADLVVPRPSADPEEKPTQLTVWAASEDKDAPSAIVFMSRTASHAARFMDYRLNQLGLYTWSGAIPALAAGSTSADVQPLNTDGLPLIFDEVSANAVADLLRSCGQLLIQEWRNPATGRSAGRDPDKRQVLSLLPGDQGATAMEDPVVAGTWFIRLQWEEQDALKYNYCFTIDCPDGGQQNVSLFHGNLICVYHGRRCTTFFRDPDSPEMAGMPETMPGAYHAVKNYERTDFHPENHQHPWTLCRLPFSPLAYQDTTVAGEVPPKSTLEVEVVTEESTRDAWEEFISLVHSDDSAEGGDHFSVETDEYGRSILRFGNGVNGRLLPAGAEIRCTYQVGRGPDGNIGADTLEYVDGGGFPEIVSCWNPFDVTNGRDPEPVEDILRRAPEAYRSRQLRAVTLWDYVDRVEELPEVSRAAARYAWTGSWRTVQIAIDPVGTTTLSPELRQRIADHLDAVRLIGEDLEIRPPRFAPLDIQVRLCIHPDYWIEDIRFLLDQEFSESYTPDGRRGFFHPDRWTFGQKLHASEIIGRIQRIQGVDHVVSVRMKRWNEATPGTDEIADVRINEILQVRNDPDHMEDGFMTFDIGGGRQ